jgi:hypothetical protein
MIKFAPAIHFTGRVLSGNFRRRDDNTGSADNHLAGLALAD